MQMQMQMQTTSSQPSKNNTPPSAPGKCSQAQTGEQAREYADWGFRMMSAMTDTVGIRKEFGQPFDAVN